MEKIKDIYIKYKEIINYIFFGGLTFIVNFVSYYILARLLGIEEVTSSGIAWVLAVLFAYITNKLFVFESRNTSKKETIKEMISFFLARILSGIFCDIGTFALMVYAFGINDIISKVVTQVMVVIMNYVLSKLVVFRKRDKKDDK